MMRMGFDYQGVGRSLTLWNNTVNGVAAGASVRLAAQPNR
jgi:hypothetical protein